MVRKISFGVGVERTFPLHSPSIAKLELVQRGRVRRAKLYYLRDLRGKKARIKERRVDEAKLAANAAAAAEEAAADRTEDADEAGLETEGSVTDDVAPASRNPMTSMSRRPRCSTSRPSLPRSWITRRPRVDEAAADASAGDDELAAGDTDEVEERAEA